MKKIFLVVALFSMLFLGAVNAKAVDVSPSLDDCTKIAFDITKSVSQRIQCILMLVTDLTAKLEVMRAEEATLPSITITSPNGGENWRVGETHNITWTTANLRAGDKAAISLISGSNPDSAPFFYRDNILLSSNSFSFTVPTGTTPTSSTYRIKIEDANGENYVGILSSNPQGLSNYFTITAPIVTTPVLPTITSLAPASGGLGIQIVINGTNFNPDTTVKFFQGGTLRTTISNAYFSATQLKLPVNSAMLSSLPLGTYQVKISNSYMYSGSLDFTLTSEVVALPSITITSPNGGENWRVGETHNITWNGTNIPSNGAITIRLQGLSADYLFSDINNLGSVSWTIPATILPGSYKIRILCGQTGTDWYCSPDGSINSNSNSEDFSNSNFTISVPPPPSIMVTLPNGGEAWKVGEVHNITWNSSNFPASALLQISLVDYSKADKPMNILSSDVNALTGRYSWTVPMMFGTSSMLGNKWKINISYNLASLPDNAIFDESESYFAITPIITSDKPSVTVTSPNGGEIIQKGSTYKIQWNELNVINPMIKLVKCTSASCSIYSIGQETNGANYFDWTVSSMITDGNNYKIRVVDSINSSIYDDSNNYFSIVSNASNLPPTISNISGPSEVAIDVNGSWLVNAKDPEEGQLSYNVIWGDGATLSGVTLQANGSFTHRYNKVGTYNAIFYVIDSIGNVQNFPFTITVSSSAPSNFTVFSPNGGEVWQRGGTYQVKWSSAKYELARIRIVNLDPKVQAYKWLADQIIMPGPSTPATNGVYSWTIPETFEPGTMYKIIVEALDYDGDGYAVGDSSNNYFTIAPVSFGINSKEAELASIADAIKKLIEEIKIFYYGNKK